MSISYLFRRQDPVSLDDDDDFAFERTALYTLPCPYTHCSLGVRVGQDKEREGSKTLWPIFHGWDTDDNRNQPAVFKLFYWVKKGERKYSGYVLSGSINLSIVFPHYPLFIRYIFKDCTINRHFPLIFFKLLHAVSYILLQMELNLPYPRLALQRAVPSSSIL